MVEHSHSGWCVPPPKGLAVFGQLQLCGIPWSYLSPSTMQMITLMTRDHLQLSFSHPSPYSLDAAKHLLNFLCLCVVSGFPVALIPQCFPDTYY